MLSSVTLVVVVLGVRWCRCEDDGKRSVCHNNQTSGVLDMYVSISNVSKVSYLGRYDI